MLVAVLVAAAVALRPILSGDDDVDLVLRNGVPVQPGPAGEPDEEERFSIDVDCTDWGCALAADEDRVYVIESGAEDFDTGETEDDEVMAYDAGSGDEAWEDPVRFEEAYDGVSIDGVFLVSTSEETVALSPDDGDELWSADGSPVGHLDGAALLVEFDADSGDATTRLVDLDDGDERWEVDGRVAVCTDDAAVTVDGGDVSRIDLSSGDEVWSESVDESWSASCGDGAVVVESDAGAVVLAMEDGDEIGDVEQDDPESGIGVAVVGEDVFVATGDQVVRHQVSGGDLEEVWSEGGPDFAYDLLPIGGDRLLVVGEDELEVLSTTDGESGGRLRIDEESRFDMTSRSVLVLDDDGIEAHDLDGLDEQWSLSVDDGTDITVGGDRVFVLAQDELLAFA